MNRVIAVIVAAALGSAPGQVTTVLRCSVTGQRVEHPCCDGSAPLSLTTAPCCTLERGSQADFDREYSSSDSAPLLAIMPLPTSWLQPPGMADGIAPPTVARWTPRSRASDASPDLEQVEPALPCESSST